MNMTKQEMYAALSILDAIARGAPRHLMAPLSVRDRAAKALESEGFYAAAEQIRAAESGAGKVGGG